MKRGRLSSLSALAVWAGGLALAITVLVRVGSGALSAPPVGHGMAGLRVWIAGRDAATVVMALFRLAGLGMAVYLTAATALGIAVRLSGVPAAVRAVDVFTVPLVRRVLAGTVGVIVAAGPLVAPSGGFASTPDPPRSSTTAALATSDDPPVMRRLPDGPGGPTTTAPPPSTSTSAIPPSTIPTTTTPAATAPAALPAATPTTSPATAAARTAAPTIVPPATLGTWTVRPGDHLWLIATTVAERHTGTADPRLVDRYWRAVIDLNRSALPDPANPDLLFSGMEIRLPPLPA